MVTLFRLHVWDRWLALTFLTIAVACVEQTPSDINPDDDAGGAHGEIRGQLVDGLGGPCPGIQVLIDEHAVTTDANGKFTVPNVPAQYDATLIEGDNLGMSVVYTGLSSRQPTLIFQGLNPASRKEARLEVTTPELDTPTIRTAYMVESDAVASYLPDQGAPQQMHSIPLNWTQGDSVHAKIYAFQIEVDPKTTEMLSYLQFAEHEVDLRDGDTHPWQVEWKPFPYDVTLAEVRFETSSGSLPSHAMVSVRFGESPRAQPFGFRIFSTPQEDTFVLLPKIPNVHYDLGETYLSSKDEQGASVATARDITSRQINILKLRSHVPTLEPLSPDAKLGPGLTLAWTNAAELETEVVLEPKTPNKDAPRLSFFVRGSSLTIPELDSLGLALPSNTPYALALRAHSYSKLDEIEGLDANDDESAFAYTHPIEIRTQTLR